MSQHSTGEPPHMENNATRPAVDASLSNDSLIVTLKSTLGHLAMDGYKRALNDTKTNIATGTFKTRTDLEIYSTDLIVSLFKQAQKLIVCPNSACLMTGTLINNGKAGGGKTSGGRIRFKCKSCTKSGNLLDLVFGLPLGAIFDLDLPQGWSDIKSESSRASQVSQSRSRSSSNSSQNTVVSYVSCTPTFNNDSNWFKQSGFTFGSVSLTNKPLTQQSNTPKHSQENVPPNVNPSLNLDLLQSESETKLEEIEPLSPFLEKYPRTHFDWTESTENDSPHKIKVQTYSNSMSSQNPFNSVTHSITSAQIPKPVSASNMKHPTQSLKPIPVIHTSPPKREREEISGLQLAMNEQIQKQNSSILKRHRPEDLLDRDQEISELSQTVSIAPIHKSDATTSADKQKNFTEVAKKLGERGKNIDPDRLASFFRHSCPPFPSATAELEKKYDVRRFCLRGIRRMAPSDIRYHLNRIGFKRAAILDIYPFGDDAVELIIEGSGFQYFVKGIHSKLRNVRMDSIDISTEKARIYGDEDFPQKFRYRCLRRINNTKAPTTLRLFMAEWLQLRFPETGEASLKRLTDQNIRMVPLSERPSYRRQTLASQDNKGNVIQIPLTPEIVSASVDALLSPPRTPSPERRAIRKRIEIANHNAPIMENSITEETEKELCVRRLIVSGFETRHRPRELKLFLGQLGIPRSDILNIDYILGNSFEIIIRAKSYQDLKEVLTAFSAVDIIILESDPYASPLITDDDLGRAMDRCRNTLRRRESIPKAGVTFFEAFLDCVIERRNRRRQFGSAVSSMTDKHSFSVNSPE